MKTQQWPTLKKHGVFAGQTNSRTASSSPPRGGGGGRRRRVAVARRSALRSRRPRPADGDFAGARVLRPRKFDSGISMAASGVDIVTDDRPPAEALFFIMLGIRFVFS